MTRPSSRRLVLRGLLLGIGLALSGFATAAEFPAVKGQHYQLQAHSRPHPPPLNRIHAWELVLYDRAGAAVTEATITVAGDMPAHRHGLPTAPRVTAVLGPGRYLLEGMKFQMPGDWELQFTIEAAAGSEILTLAFTL